MGRHFYIFTALFVIGIAVVPWILLTRGGDWNLQRYVGSVLAVVGISFVALARYQLGRSFSVKAEAHQLITAGLYSKIRNPIYVFGVVMLFGLALVLQRPFLWIFVALAVPVQVVRARREARVLESAFGDAYREYRRKTWF